MSMDWQVRQGPPSSGSKRGRKAVVLSVAAVLVVALGGYVALASGEDTPGALEGSLRVPGGDGAQVDTSEQPAGSLDLDGEEDAAPAEAEPSSEAEGAAEAPPEDEAEPSQEEPFVFDPYDATSVAVAMSQKLFPDGQAENIILARDIPTGDALAAGALIGLFDTTLLLTDSDRLSPLTVTEIDRLGQPNVHILGGPDAVSAEIEAQLVDAGHNVHRHAGYLQAQTAVDIAGAHFGESQTAVIVQTPDASAGPVEALSSALAATGLAAARDLPVLLTQGDNLSPATESYLQGSVITDAIVIGDEDDLGPAITNRLRELGIDSTRASGSDRFETAVEVARSRGFSSIDLADSVILVEGSHDAVWPAGFLGTVLAAHTNGPILLSDGTDLPPATAQYLSDGSAEDVHIICTPGVTTQACSAARDQVAGDSSS